MIGRRTSHIGLAALALALAFPATPAFAEEEGPITFGAEITVDLAGTVSGASDERPRVLTNVNLVADLDLARLAGWRGATMHVDVLDNRGGRPNDATGTLQGVDNIEVPDAGLRLFEAWVEQDLGRGATMRFGLYDVNSEFYANDAAGLLIAPPFGIGSELAATGPNGPSIFPSSALAMRVHVPLGSVFARFGVVNARASTLGDNGGIDFSFRDGVLLIGEVGRAGGRVRGTLGAWRYSRSPEDLAETGADGAPLHKPAQGAYGVVEVDLLADDARQLTAFLRLGLSDPHTTPYRGGLQAGFLLAPAIAGREDSQVSLGLHHAWTSDHFREAVRAEGGTPANETVVELTYADRVFGPLVLQPDIQWVRHPGGDRARQDAVVAIMRARLSF